MDLADTVLTEIVEHLIADYHAHTILLYGSRSDGSFAADSDYDLAAFAPIENENRNNKLINNSFWDVFVYPESILSSPNKDYLKLRNSRILIQKGTRATEFLAGLDNLFNAGPAQLTPAEIEVRVQWAQKMCARLQRNDIEGNYRRVWLLTTLLEDYFDIRKIWYQGPKKSFIWLRENSIADFQSFKRALIPSASPEDIKKLIQCVFNIE